MTEIDWAISSSFASITGAVAAIAEPPQTEDPTPISIEIFVGIFIALYRIKATIREVLIVERIIGKDWNPVDAITDRFIPKPKRITAYCRIFFEVKEIPGLRLSLFFINNVIIIPKRIENTGPPITGTSSPNIHAGTAISMHSKIPDQFVLSQFIEKLPSVMSIIPSIN